MALEGQGARPGAQGRRFRRRELELAEGGKLVLHTDGSIHQLGDQGETKQTWAPGDPEWARHAIRFGLLPQPSTTVPPDARVRAAKTLVG